MRHLRPPIAVIVALFFTIVTVPADAEIHLHNGYIEIVDHVHYKIAKDGQSSGQTDPKASPLKFDVAVKGNAVFQSEKLHVMHGGYTIINSCCILTGTSYSIRVFWPGLSFVGNFSPRVCNVQGTPVGFLKLAIVGQVTRIAGKGDTLDMTHGNTRIKIEQLDTKCAH